MKYQVENKKNLLTDLCLSIKRFDKTHWIITTPQGKNILLNERASNLLIILINSDSFEDAISRIQKKLQLQLTKQELEALIQNTFKGYGILQGEEITPNTQSSYLSLKVPVLNAKIAGFLASPIKFIFQPSIFWSLFIFTFLLNLVTAIYYFYLGLLTTSTTNIKLFTLLLGFSMLVHELGHIAACRKFGIQHGAIGFGFYFIFPVVYADITQVWTATKSQRIIANAGGIYLELIYGSVLFLIFFITKDFTFLLSTVAVFLKAITELNPFIRYDGYWLLSDISNTPNLMKKSNEALRNFFSVKNQKINFRNLPSLRWNVSKRDSLLLSYSLANTSLLLSYIIYVLINFHKELIYFPQLLLSLIQKAIGLKLSFADFPYGFLWMFGLYILVFRIATQLIGKQMKKILVRFSHQRLD